jgi:3',5'-cyclic AMP phosphodiesterase CpdA
MPDTIILRFRDLVGPTIAEHRRLIATEGYVWWGWWNKPAELVPRRVFADLRAIIDAQGAVEVFLADSGNTRLYRARVTSIVESPTEEKIPTPEADKTPPYYNQSPNKAWFRLAAIEDADVADLREFAYDEIPARDFVEDPASSAFDQKRIWDLAEVLQRHRTIYFIRRATDADQDWQIQLSPRATPEPFTTSPNFAKSNYIVQLSDLHFSATEHRFPRETAGTDRNLAITLIDDLHALYGDKPPAAVVLSGDLTWLGAPSEYRWARDFVEQLMSAFGLDWNHFVTVPGNHDMQWARATTTYDRNAEVRAQRKRAQRNYRTFIRDTFGYSPNTDVTMGRRYVLSNYRAVDIIGLNSTRLEQRHFRGYGFVGRETFVRAAEAMGWTTDHERTTLKMVVLHHHVLPVTPREEITTYDRIYSLTLDAGELLYTALELGIDFFVHGHMHQPFVGSYSRFPGSGAFSAKASVGVHGAGSVAVRAAHLGAFGTNSYTIFEFGDLATVRTRTWSDQISGFEDRWRAEFVANPDGGMRLT